MYSPRRLLRILAHSLITLYKLKTRQNTPVPAPHRLVSSELMSPGTLALGQTGHLQAQK